MKRILLLLIFVSSFLFSEEVVFSNIDECKTDVYFGNGILTIKEDAITNAGILEDAIIEKIGLDYYQKKIGKVDYAYNKTIGKIEDLRESLRQVVNVTGLIDAIVQWLPGTLETQHHADIKAQVDKYEASIRLGHRVLVVAHSQGNLFAQEAYEKLGDRSAAHDKWLQKYWEAISIASPDPYSEIKPDMLPRIGWDNDVVAWIGRGFNHNGIESDVRHVTWEGKAHLSDNPIPPKPNQPYLYRNQIPSTYKNFWRATEGWRDELDSNVHAFSFYMGLPIKEGDEENSRYKEVYKNWYTNKELTDDAAKILIMDQIQTQLDKLEKLSSQWKAQNLGCTCKGKYAKLTHRYEKDTFKFPQEEVKDFAKDQEVKIYPVEGKYVRAQCGGTKIEEIDEGDTCLALSGQEGRIGTISGDDKTPKGKPGVVNLWGQELNPKFSTV